MSLRNRKSAKSFKDQYDYRKKLPFFVSTRKRLPKGVKRPDPWWNVSPTGDYGVDYATGQEYSAAFWRECGARNAGIDLGQILFAMHARKSLSGIEVGFIRGIGDIISIMKIMPALVNALMKKPRGAKSKTPKITSRQIKGGVRVAQMLLEAKQARDRKREAEIEEQFAKKDRRAIGARMIRQKAA